MTRTTIAAAAVTVALVAAGCGSATTSAPTHSKSTTTTQAVKAPVIKTAEQLGLGYYNMRLLGSDLKTQVQKKIDADPTTAGSTVKDMSCISTGGQTAECNATYSDGETESVDVHIATNGLEYITAS